MKSLEEIRVVLSAHQEELARKYSVSQICVFGSYSRGQQKETSDIDILVQFSQSIGLLKFLELEYFLSGLLGAKVDLVTRSALKPYIGQRILQEVVCL